MGRFAIQNLLKPNSSDFYLSASKPNLYFILTTGLIVRSIYRTVYMQTGVNVNISPKNRLQQFYSIVANLIWDLTNNNYSLYFLLFLTISVNIRLCYIFIPWQYIVGALSKLAETSFFCWRLHKYDLLQFMWYKIKTQ